MSAAEEEVREVLTAESGTLAVLSASEINQQIATAHKFPRSVRRFLDEAKQLVTLSEETADECIYALPRDGKTIEGPSARFAEIVAYSWGNARAGARVMDDAGDFVTAQGVFHDLEKNVAITYEVKRRITDKHGRRFKPDMIGVTANAACSIALRNAILKGVPKALWSTLYETARQIVMGTAETLANRRAAALAYLQKFGATEDMVLALLQVQGIEDITLDHLVTLRGIATAIREGDTTVEQAFAAPGQAATSAETDALNEKLRGAAKGAASSSSASTPQQAPRAKEAHQATQDSAAPTDTGAAGTEPASAEPRSQESAADLLGDQGAQVTLAQVLDMVSKSTDEDDDVTCMDVARGLGATDRKKVASAIAERRKARGAA